MYGCTYEQVLESTGADRQDALFKFILDKYKALEQQCDVTVCVGTDFSGAMPLDELGFNAEMAYNLVAPSFPLSKAGTNPPTKSWTL